MPGAAIEWYYQYQTLYLRMMAKKQMAENAATEGSDKDQDTDSCQMESSSTEKTIEKNLDDTTGSEAIVGTRDSSEYACPRCGNAYLRLHSLNRHIKFECGVEPRFECPVCHKKSKHKHNLNLHMRTHQKS